MSLEKLLYIAINSSPNWNDVNRDQYAELTMNSLLHENYDS